MKIYVIFIMKIKYVVKILKIRTKMIDYHVKINHGLMKYILNITNKVNFGK